MDKIAKVHRWFWLVGALFIAPCGSIKWPNYGTPGRCADGDEELSRGPFAGVENYRVCRSKRR